MGDQHSARLKKDVRTILLPADVMYDDALELRGSTLDWAMTSDADIKVYTTVPTICPPAPGFADSRNSQETGARSNWTAYVQSRIFAPQRHVSTTRMTLLALSLGSSAVQSVHECRPLAARWVAML